MKRVMTLCLSALLLIGTLAPTALAAEIAAPCYPTSVTRSEDGGEIRTVSYTHLTLPTICSV